LRAVGDEDPETAVMYENLGHAYYSMAKFDEAIDLWGKASVINERILGPEHPRTAGIKGHIEKTTMLLRVAPPESTKSYLIFSYVFFS
jgi:tetratricopeptide (TPR) repeat protein